MPWCPGCSYEYVAGAKKCPECGCLIRKAPGLDEQNEMRHRNRKWSLIRKAADLVHAELIKNFLRTNGFEVAVRDGDSIGRAILGAAGSPGAGALILVPSESARDAAVLLRSDTEWTEKELSDYMEDHGELEVEEEEGLLTDDEAADIVESGGLVHSGDDEEEVF